MTPRDTARIAAVIVLVSLVHAALTAPETRPYTTILAALAAVVLALIHFTRLGEVKAGAPAAVSSARSRRRGLVLLWASLALLVVHVAWVPWKPRYDFDVLGFAWALDNAWQLLVAIALVAGAAIGLAMWKPRAP